MPVRVVEDPIEEIEEELLVGRGRRRLEARDVDYIAVLTAPIADPDDQCPHTTKVERRSGCSQCAGVSPRTVSGKTQPIVDDLFDFGDES